MAEDDDPRSLAEQAGLNDIAQALYRRKVEAEQESTLGNLMRNLTPREQNPYQEYLNSPNRFRIGGGADDPNQNPKSRKRRYAKVHYGGPASYADDSSVKGQSRRFR